jgi:hypothetical protein
LSKPNVKKQLIKPIIGMGTLIWLPWKSKTEMMGQR